MGGKDDTEATISDGGSCSQDVWELSPKGFYMV